MKEWNGLLRKEWIIMKWLLIVSALVAIVVMTVIPVAIASYFPGEMDVFEVTLVVCLLWAGASIGAPLIAFIIMFQRDMKSPEIWLHSTASIFKLVGSKAFCAVLIGAASLLIPTAILAVHYALVKTSLYSFDELLFFGSMYIVMIFRFSIFIMSVGFLFLVIDRLIKPYLKSFSILVTFLLFFLSSKLYGQVESSELYRKMTSFGPIDLSHFEKLSRQTENGYLAINSPVIYSGDIVVNTLLTVFFFIGAAVLFERKVRL